MRLFFLSLYGNREKFRNWQRETGRFPSLFHSGELAAAQNEDDGGGEDRQETDLSCRGRRRWGEAAPV